MSDDFLRETLRRLTVERERLRAAGADAAALEANRLAIGRSQRELAVCLITRYARPEPQGTFIVRPG